MTPEDLTIRAAAPADAAALLEIYAPYVEKTAVTFAYAVPSAEEFAGRIARTLERYPYLIAMAEGRIMGYACAGPFKERAAYDWAAETTVYVRRDGRRRGTGRALYAALERQNRNEMEAKAVANKAAKNTGKKSVHSKKAARNR